MRCAARVSERCANANAKLDLPETWTYTCSTSNVLASFQNLATAKGTPPVGPDVTDQDTAEVVVIHPAIQIVKSPDYADRACR